MLTSGKSAVGENGPKISRQPKTGEQSSSKKVLVTLSRRIVGENTPTQAESTLLSQLIPSTLQIIRIPRPITVLVTT